MDRFIEATQSLPDKYEKKIAVHLIPGDINQLTMALDAALACFADIEMKSGQSMTKEQKNQCGILAWIRSGLAVELLRLEGFDFAAAKARGKAEADTPKDRKQKGWVQPVADVQLTI
ncbi:MAG: hypothetical protein ACJAWL_002952 [Motiliproteus sp.]|jgi:hypothetical protein